MPKIKIAPTGNSIKGHVLDSSPKYVESALKSYDPQLYIKWNSKKVHGWGCWEIRWKPENKTAKWSRPLEYLPNGNVSPAEQGDIYVWDNYTIVYPKYTENDLNNHVLDVPFLNYGVLKRIKEMDMWKEELGFKGKNLTKELDYKEATWLDKIEDIAFKERDYQLKQHKSEIRWFKEFLTSGGNPYRLADYWGK